MLPPLRILPTVEDYRRYYEKTYCRNGVVTFDGIWVHFFPETFNHAFSVTAIGKPRTKLYLIRNVLCGWIGFKLFLFRLSHIFINA